MPPILSPRGVGTSALLAAVARAAEAAPANLLFSKAGEPTIVSTWFHDSWAALVSSEPCQAYMRSFHALLLAGGVPEPHPTADHLAIGTLAFFAALLLFWLLIGRRQLGQLDSTTSH